MLASPASGSSSRSRLRMVTFGQTTSTASEKRASLRSFTLLRMLQAASMPMTVVLPEAGGHLAGVALEARAAELLLVVAGVVARHGQPLAKVGAGLGQEDDGFRRF